MSNKLTRALRSGVIGGALLLAAALGNTAVASTVYTNSPAGNTQSSFGSNSSAGETFTLGSAEELLNWSFDASLCADGSPPPLSACPPDGKNVEFEIADWNGSSIGSVLYTSVVSNDATPLAFNPDLDLAAGSYIAFLTNAGVTNPTAQFGLLTTASNAGLGGGGYYTGAPSGTWNANPSFIPGSFGFSATLAPVPVPGALWLLPSGLAGLGVLKGWRRAATP